MLYRPLALSEIGRFRRSAGAFSSASVVRGTPPEDQGSRTPARLDTLHHLLEAISAPAATLFPEGLIAQVNRPFADLLGAAPGCLQGTPFLNWVAAEERDRFRHLLTRAWQLRSVRADLLLQPDYGERLGVQLSLRRMAPPDRDVLLLVLADLDAVSGVSVAAGRGTCGRVARITAPGRWNTTDSAGDPSGHRVRE